MANFSDYIVYADESGSATLDGADPHFPVFVLAMALVRKDDYANAVVPSVQKLKFDFVGHDQLILHERDIRRQKSAFAFLQVDPLQRAAFLKGIDDIVQAAPIKVFAAVIHKTQLTAKYADPWSPYELALYFLMERLLSVLLLNGQAGKIVHVVFECRGKKEDNELELAFRRIAANHASWGWKNTDFAKIKWEPLFVDKKSNSSGLQLADLFARPIGLHRLNPAQTNHAYALLTPKIAAEKWFP